MVLFTLYGYCFYNKDKLYIHSMNDFPIASFDSKTKRSLSIFIMLEVNCQLET